MHTGNNNVITCISYTVIAYNYIPYKLYFIHRKINIVQNNILYIFFHLYTKCIVRVLTESHFRTITVIIMSVE